MARYKQNGILPKNVDRILLQVVDVKIECVDSDLFGPMEAEIQV